MKQIKLIEKDTDLSKENLVKLRWDAFADGQLLDVYRIKGYYHTIGGRYGDNNLWCCRRGEKPSYDTLMEFNGSPCCFSIHADEINYSTTHWSETSVENNIKISILRNNEPFFSFCCREVNYGFAKAQEILVSKIYEGIFDFCNQDFQSSIVGRKIYYRDQPAVITRYIPGQCSVWIEPDGIEKFNRPVHFESENWEEYERGLKINLLSDNMNVWWFRD